jgi:uncharacterized membrane protein
MTEQPPIDPIYPQVAAVLRTGFRIAAGFLLIGVVVALIRQESLADRVDPFSKIPNALLDVRARAFIDLAVISIMLTPLAAVGTILRGFLAAGDVRFAWYAGAVLAILVASILLSLFQ